MAGCLGCFDIVGARKTSTWRSALCGCLPVALAVLWIDWLHLVLDMWIAANPQKISFGDFKYETPKGCQSYFLVLGHICGIIAAVGVFSQRVNWRLARVAFYWHVIETVCCIVALIIVIPGAIINLAFVYTHELLCIYSSLIVCLAVIVVVEIWLLHLHRSLLQIIEAGGSGWEYLSAEEVALDKKAESLEDGHGDGVHSLLPATYI